VVYFCRKPERGYTICESKCVSAGEEVAGVKEKDTIYFDRHAGHKIEVDKKSYHVIKSGDIVVVL